jgi:hypothetical protein
VAGTCEHVNEPSDSIKGGESIESVCLFECVCVRVRARELKGVRGESVCEPMSSRVKGIKLKSITCTLE